MGGEALAQPRANKASSECSSLPRFGENASCGLTNDLDRPNQRKTQHLVLIQVAALLVLYESQDRQTGVAHVQDANAILRPHIAPGRSR